MTMSLFDQAVSRAMMMTSIAVSPSMDRDDGYLQRKIGLYEEQKRASGAPGLPGRPLSEHRASRL